MFAVANICLGTASLFGKLASHRSPQEYFHFSIAEYCNEKLVAGVRFLHAQREGAVLGSTTTKSARRQILVRSAPRQLGNPRFSQTFLHGKLSFPDPFHCREQKTHFVPFVLPAGIEPTSHPPQG